MTYVPTHDPWVATDTLTTTALNNFETIYDETYNGCLITHNHDTLYETQTEMRAKYYYAANVGTGSGADADLIHTTNYGDLHATQLSAYAVKAGLIVLWYGSIASIPTGWALCDGTNGTRDLTDKFVMGAATEHPVGNTGGSNTITPQGTFTLNSHTLTLDELGPHTHPFIDKSVTAFTPNQYNTTGVDFTGSPNQYTSGNTTATGGGGSHTHSAAEGTAITSTGASQMPYYYALAYIQKL